MRFEIIPYYCFEHTKKPPLELLKQRLFQWPQDWNDLRRSDLTMINREKGSGTRILLDEHLRKMGILGKSINGYMRESQSHIAIASTVARGDADLGIGNEKACLQVQGIDFIPIQKEQYDMVVKKEDINCPAFEAIFEILRSDEFKFELQGLGGYDLTELGKVIAETRSSIGGYHE